MKDDLISRQAAINEWKNDFKGYINALDIPKDDYKGIMEYIDELPSVQPGWISTSERTPEKSGNYLVTTPDGQVELRYYSTLYRWNGWVDMVAWMPLPLKWEGGQE